MRARLCVKACAYAGGARSGCVCVRAFGGGKAEGMGLFRNAYGGLSAFFPSLPNLTNRARGGHRTLCCATPRSRRPLGPRLWGGRPRWARSPFRAHRKSSHSPPSSRHGDNPSFLGSHTLPPSSPQGDGGACLLLHRVTEVRVYCGKGCEREEGLFLKLIFSLRVHTNGLHCPPVISIS